MNKYKIDCDNCMFSADTTYLQVVPLQVHPPASPNSASEQSSAMKRFSKQHFIPQLQAEHSIESNGTGSLRQPYPQDIPSLVIPTSNKIHTSHRPQESPRLFEEPKPLHMSIRVKEVPNVIEAPDRISNYASTQEGWRLNLTPFVLEKFQQMERKVQAYEQVMASNPQMKQLLRQEQLKSHFKVMQQQVQDMNEQCQKARVPLGKVKRNFEDNKKTADKMQATVRDVREGCFLLDQCQATAQSLRKSCKYLAASIDQV